MTATCDLHIHSTASDGTDPPEALPAIARQSDVSAIALTDHDTTQGLPACARACEEAGIDFVPGIELSVDPGNWPGHGGDQPPARRGTLHILGLFVRHDDPGLHVIHQRLLQARADRNPQIIDNLNELGVRIAYKEVQRLAEAQDTQVIGRPHIAQVMLNKGYVKSVHDAFARYIGEGQPAYVRKDLLSAGDAIEAIHQAGGLALMAHPVQLHYGSHENLEHFVRKLRDSGLDGIETIHSDHTPAQVQQFENLAKQFDLLTTGGSDYHGTRKPIAMGSQHVDRAVYETLRAAWAQRYHQPSST